MLVVLALRALPVLLFLLVLGVFGLTCPLWWGFWGFWGWWGFYLYCLHCGWGLVAVFVGVGVRGGVASSASIASSASNAAIAGVGSFGGVCCLTLSARALPRCALGRCRCPGPLPALLRLPVAAAAPRGSAAPAVVLAFAVGLVRWLRASLLLPCAGCCGTSDRLPLPARCCASGWVFAVALVLPWCLGEGLFCGVYGGVVALVAVG